MFYRTNYDSFIGSITLACNEKNELVGLWMENQKYFGDTIDEEMIEEEMPVLIQTKAWLDRYFNGKKPDINELSLSPIGNEFRQEVWQILKEIPYGEVITYGDIAKKIAIKKGIQSMSAQAVGGAVGHNPISIIIPCHRIVGSNKSLTGFSGGLEKKTKLLKHEGVDTSKLIVPTKGTAL